MLIACALGSPLICVLLHAVHERHWPWNSSARHVRWAGPAAGAMVLGWVLLTAGWSQSPVLALTLPLAALSAAGMIYVPCVRAWPRPTVLLSLVSALCAAVVSIWI